LTGPTGLRAARPLPIMTTRWFVEVSPVDADTLKERYCVEALQWQHALAQARKLRGDTGGLSRFAIELLEAGYRATDPAARLRYLVSKAPGDEPLSAEHSNGASHPDLRTEPLAAPPLDAILAPPSVAAPSSNGKSRKLSANSTSPQVPRAKLSSKIPLPRRDFEPPTLEPTTDPEQRVLEPATDPDPIILHVSPPAALAPEARLPSAPEPQLPSAPFVELASVLESQPEIPLVVTKAALLEELAPPAETPAVALPPEVLESAPDAAPPPEPEEAAPQSEAVPSLPGLDLVSLRKEEPTEASPITYREFAFHVTPGLTAKELERYARAAWEQVRTAIAHRAAGKFVQIALFDHRFHGRPERAPVAVLAWKDWRGDPVLQIRERPTTITSSPESLTAPQIAAPAPVSFVAPAPAVSPPPPERARPISSPPPPVQPSFPAPASHAAPEPARPVVEPARPRPEVARAIIGPRSLARRRGPAEDLIGELFEEMHQLHFMPDIVAGAEYVISVLARVMPSEGTLVHVFDINTRQFVVVRALGPNGAQVLLERTPDTFPLFREAFRRGRSLSFASIAPEDGFDGRWERLGVAVRAAICGPVKHGGRYLGVIELANPAGGGPFHDSEVNAVDYICEQFADFVASRPIVLDDDAVVPK
jgi:hypothetical protein